MDSASAVRSMGSRKYPLVLGAVVALNVGFPDPVVATQAGEGLPIAYSLSEEPRIQIGTVDGDGSSLFGITDAIRLRDGRILVADGGSGSLKFFDSRGAFVRAVGRAGDGPGEFRRLGRVSELEDGAIAALALLLGRVTVFSPDGGLERTHNVSRGFRSAGRSVHLYGFLADGNLVGLEEIEEGGVEANYGDFPSSTLTYRAPVVQPMLIDTLGRTVPFGRSMPGNESLYQRQASIGSETIRVGGQNVLAPFLRRVAVAVRGTWIALGPIEGHLVGAFNARDGAPRGFVGLFGGPPPKEVPQRLQDEWIDERVTRFPCGIERRTWRDRYEEFLASAPGPMTFPPFKALALQEGGAVWREVYDPALEDGGPSHWIVTDPSTLGFGGTAVLPPGFRPYDIGRDYVLGGWRDELGIEFVRMYDLIEASPDGSR